MTFIQLVFSQDSSIIAQQCCYSELLVLASFLHVKQTGFSLCLLWCYYMLYHSSTGAKSERHQGKLYLCKPICSCKYLLALLMWVEVILDYSIVYPCSTWSSICSFTRNHFEIKFWWGLGLAMFDYHFLSQLICMSVSNDILLCYNVKRSSTAFIEVLICMKWVRFEYFMDMICISAKARVCPSSSQKLLGRSKTNIQFTLTIQDHNEMLSKPVDSCI